MNTEPVTEKIVVTPAITADVPAPVPAPVEPDDVVGVEDKQDRRFGSRKIITADGAVSYGTTKSGEVRRKPGRKPKSAE